MRCPELSELPLPPPGKQGWPWTEQSQLVREHPSENRSWPRITIVTPSFNHGRFIEETIRSVLLQGYTDLEYFVLDGGSTDNTVEIIEKYSSWMSFWVSEHDRGQSAAINRGLRMGSGFYATWINSDDMLCKNALANQVLKIGLDGDFIYAGDCVNVDETGKILFTHRGRVNSLEDLVRIPTVWHSGGYICQPEVLFPLDLARRVGGLNEQNHLTMDYELWGQFLLADAKFHYTGIPFGMFRRHDAQKTQLSMEQTESMLRTAVALLGRANCLPVNAKREIQADLLAYWEAYPQELWKQSGRLARIGLPRGIVTALREAKRKMERVLTTFSKSCERSK